MLYQLSYPGFAAAPQPGKPETAKRHMEFSTGLATGAHFRFGKKRGFQKGENARTRRNRFRSMQAAYTFGFPKKWGREATNRPRPVKANFG